jgi:hypothetical protein
MSSNGRTEARKIHDRSKHPILDADGHWAEFPPLMREEFRKIGEEDFRNFMFDNAVRFWGEVNPDFFQGTVVEKRAAEVLAQGR